MSNETDDDFPWKGRGMGRLIADLSISGEQGLTLGRRPRKPRGSGPPKKPPVYRHSALHQTFITLFADLRQRLQDMDTPRTPLVSQRTANDAFLCCLSMAFGIHYEAWPCVIGEYLETHLPASVGEFTWLAGLSKQNGRLRCVPTGVKLEEWEVWGRRALLHVPSLEAPDYNWHVVYWDGYGLLDPANTNRYRALGQVLGSAHHMWLLHELVPQT